jgi:glycosyltransferase involved in cell wall biosynthesis
LSRTIPKVLIVDLSEKFGGASARVLALMLKYPPGQIALAALKDSPVARYAKDKNLPVIIVGKRKYDFFILFALIRAIRSSGFEIIDVQNIQSKFWASLSLPFTKTVLVSTLNSWYSSEHGTKSLKGKAYIAVELLTNWSSPHYIVVSKTIYNNLRDAGVATDRISLIYNAVDPEIKKISANKIGIRSEFNMPENAILCVALGRLVWAKGYEDLIQAIKIVKEKNPQIFCLILGEGELRSSLAEQISRSGLADRIILYGHCEHPVALSILMASDIFVMPSRIEGAPIALLEAAILELPIVATKVGGIPELLTEEEAILVPANNPICLASSLLKFAEDLELARLLARKARQRVRKYFTIDIQVENTIATYNKVLLHG